MVRPSTSKVIVRPYCTPQGAGIGHFAEDFLFALRLPTHWIVWPASALRFCGVRQIGLKIEMRKVPMETIVIDHAEKQPTEN
jgi:hypothetical protein